jgi:hypothetical protein
MGGEEGGGGVGQEGEQEAARRRSIERCPASPGGDNGGGGEGGGGGGGGEEGGEEEGEEEDQEGGAVVEEQAEVDLHRSTETGTFRKDTTRLRSRGLEGVYVTYLRTGVWSMKPGHAYPTWATLIDCAEGGHPPLSHKLRDVGDGEAPDSFCSELSLKRSPRITSLPGVTPCTADVCV